MELRDTIKNKTLLMFVAIVCTIFIPCFLQMRADVAGVIEQSGAGRDRYNHCWNTRRGFCYGATSLMVLMMFLLIFSMHIVF